LARPYCQIKSELLQFTHGRDLREVPIKCLFKHRKTRYRGLAKNNAQLFTLFAFTNLVLARRFLGRQHTQVAP
jgi:IS5 family transposase